MALPLIVTAPPEARNVEDLEVDLLLTAVAEHYGYDFRHYARASLKRRLRHAMLSEGVTTLSQLQDRVLHSSPAFDQMIANISVHVTSMFRDPPFYKALVSHVVPHLKTYPFIRIWVAGCSTGEEVHSLAILLEEAGIYDRCRIYATDISDGLLERAARGVYPIGALRGYTQNYQRSGGKLAFSDYYIADEKHAVFRARLRKNVIFSRHNLACDGPFNEFNLILCRNVMIYFDRDLREHVHGLLHASLARFGILALGQKESLALTRVTDRYADLVPEQRIFRSVR
jgi:chemotaxis protein methyltransferase CheR